MYTKTNWVARVGTALNRFLKTNESAGSVELTNDPTGVTTAGTPFTVANMNKIEEGIYDAHYPEFTEAATLTNIASGEVQETLWGKVKKAIATVITHDGYLNQGVKATDSPTFVNVHARVDSAQFWYGAKRAIVYNKTQTGSDWYYDLISFFPSMGDEISAGGYIILSDSTRILISSIKSLGNAIAIYGSNRSTGVNSIALYNDNTISYEGRIIL